MGLALVALILISIAWFLQFFSMNKKKKDVDFLFILFYTTGSICLILDSLTVGSASYAYLNAIPLLGALLVLGKMLKK